MCNELKSSVAQHSFKKKKSTEKYQLHAVRIHMGEAAEQ